MADNEKVTISLDPSVVAALSKAALQTPLKTHNALIAAAAFNLSKVRPENLWHAIGRIREGEPEFIEDQPAKLKTRARQALPA